MTFNTYEDQDIDTDPIIVLGCGHFYSTSTLDGIMELGNASWMHSALFKLMLIMALIPFPAYPTYPRQSI